MKALNSKGPFFLLFPTLLLHAPFGIPSIWHRELFMEIQNTVLPFTALIFKFVWVENVTVASEWSHSRYTGSITYAS